MSIGLPSEPIHRVENRDEREGKEMTLDQVPLYPGRSHNHNVNHDLHQNHNPHHNPHPSPQGTSPTRSTSFEGQWPTFLPSEGETMTTGTTEETDLGLALPLAVSGFVAEGKMVQEELGGVKTHAGYRGGAAGEVVFVVGEDVDDQHNLGIGFESDAGVWDGYARLRQRMTTTAAVNTSTSSDLYNNSAQPALTLTQSNVSRLPGHSPYPTTSITATATNAAAAAGQPMLKRFGLERTASWASGSGSVGTSAGRERERERTCPGCFTPETYLGQGKADGGTRPGYKRSRTAYSGVSSGSMLRPHGLGLRPSDGVLGRSRSFSVNSPVGSTVGQTSGSAKQEVGSFHPYRLVTPSAGSGSGSGKKSRPRELELNLRSPLFSKSKNTDMDLEDDDTPSSSVSSFHHHKERLLRPSSLIRSHSDARFEQTSSAVHRRRAGLLRPRLWSHHSHPSRLRPSGHSSVSLRVGEVNEYMMDMDKWILGAGIDTVNSARSAVPEIVRTAPVEEQEDVSSVDAAEDQEGEDGKLWVDGRRVVCSDGTECLATSEAYILTVQLMHQAYSTSMYLSKEYNLHISGEKTHLEEYQRVVEYPKTADMDKMKATLVDGLVSVHVPRLAHAPSAAPSTCIRQRIE